MQIEYKILWIDDEKLKSQISRVKRYLEDELHFVAKIVKCKSEAELNKKKMNFENFDLILLDYQLSNSKTTDNILKKIKSKNYCSEICFYSSKGNFLDHVKEDVMSFEGVFFQEGRRELVDKVKDIINLTLKKFQDLNNLRGLVMAETSDLDGIKVDILEKALKKKVINELFFYENVISIIISFHKGQIKEINKYCDKKVNTILESIEKKYPKHTLDKLIGKNCFNSDLKKDAIDKIIKILRLKSKYNNKEYKKEIQSKRNKLGHEREIMRNGKIYYGKYQFNENECKKIRRYIKKYRVILEKVLNDLKKI